MNQEPILNLKSAGSLPAISPPEDEVIVLGIGGHAKVIISVLQALGYRIVEAYDDNAALWGAKILGVPVVGPFSAIGATRRAAVIGVGDNRLRARIAASLSLKWLTLVHPAAVVHQSVRLGPGTVVFAGAIVQPDCTLGAHVIVNTSASVDHDCIVGDFAHISPGAHLAGGVEIGTGAFMGIGSVAAPRVHIGAWTMVGAGAAVVRDLPAEVTAVGVPAHQKMWPRPAASEDTALPTSGAPAPEVSAPVAFPATAASASVEAEFIATSDPRWREFLAETPHDFYHLPEYVQLEAGQSGGQASAFYARQGEAQFLVPLVLSRSPFSRDLSPEWVDAASPYGYPCPLLKPAGDAAQLQSFLEAFRKTSADENIVTAFLRLHPLLPLPLEPLTHFGQLIRHGACVYFDLNLSEEEISSAIMGNHCDNIKRLRNKGFEIRMDEWQWYPNFMAAYDATMRRLNAEQRYFFSDDYFLRLKTALGERLHLGTVLSPTGEVAGGGLFITTCDIVQCHLMGTTDTYHRRSPTKLLVDYAWRWAKERGAKYLFFGGGVGGREDSLFHYKAGFARGRADFHSFRMVLDPVKYQQLIERWRQAGGKITEDDDFFPLYRRPLE